MNLAPHINFKPLVLACGKGLLISLFLTPILRDIFRCYNVVDRPASRKLHAYPIPRIGGISIAIAYTFALMSLSGSRSDFPVQWLSGPAMIFLTGLLDDFYNLRPVVKLGGQAVAGGLAFASGLTLDRVGIIVLPTWLSLVLTISWFLLASNALNLIDGLDGLCAGVGLWATLVFFVGSFTRGNLMLAETAFPLVGVLLGFLLFNLPPATVFLGDSGALLIGFVLGCFGIIWTGHQITISNVLLPIFALSLPLTDLGLSVFRRFLRNKPIFSADREHVHHKLLGRGLTVRRAVLVLYSASIIGAVFGLALTYSTANIIVNTAIATIAAVMAIIGIQQLGYDEIDVGARLLFRGELMWFFAEKLRMERLRRSLELARTREEWWRLLAETTRDQHWIRLRWTGADGVREEMLASRKPCWLFTIELGDAEFIEVEGDVQLKQGWSDLVSFSKIATLTFQRTRQSEQLAVS